MDKRRMGEIALALTIDRVREKGFMLKPAAIKKEFGNVSKRTGIPMAELQDFFADIATQLVGEAFNASEE